MEKRKLALASLFLSTTLLLTSCNKEGAIGNIQDSINDKVSNSLPNLFVTLAQLGAFLVTLLIFFIFAYKPIKKRLIARREKIKQKEIETNEAKIEAERNAQSAKTQIDMAKAQALDIIDNAKSKASLEAEKIIEKANQDAILIKQDGINEAEKIKKEAASKSSDIIVETAILASKEILGRNINQKDNEKIVNEFIQKMKEDNK